MGFHIVNPAVKTAAPAMESSTAQSIAQQHEPIKQARTRGTGSGRHGGARPRPPVIDLHQPGHLSVGNVMALFGLASSTTFYAWLADGRIPPPDGRNPRPYWKTETINAWLVR